MRLAPERRGDWHKKTEAYKHILSSGRSWTVVVVDVCDDDDKELNHTDKVVLLCVLKTLRSEQLKGEISISLHQVFKILGIHNIVYVKKGLM